MTPIDLHCHTLHSDGELSTKDLLFLAKKNGCKHLAITDHDRVTAIPEARIIANKIGINLIAGVEISVTWENRSIHIIGLNVDETNQELIDGLTNIAASRFNRGVAISKKLDEIGIFGSLDYVMNLANSNDAISRTHFAEFLIQYGYATSKDVFSRFLSEGKVAYIEHEWCSLATCLSLIQKAGGVAVIAHPARYGFADELMCKLTEEFKSFGGIGIELISSAHSKKDEKYIANLSKKYKLYCSVGSDFHTKNKNSTLGINKNIPNDLMSIFDIVIPKHR